MSINNSVGNNRRAHVHRNVRVLPNFRCLPLAVLFGQSESVCALPSTGDDQVSASPKRVEMFSCHSSGNGTDQSSFPFFASRPTIEPSVRPTICDCPFISTTTGEA